MNKNPESVSIDIFSRSLHGGKLIGSQSARRTTVLQCRLHRIVTLTRGYTYLALLRALLQVWRMAPSDPEVAGYVVRRLLFLGNLCPRSVSTMSCSYHYVLGFHVHAWTARI